MTSTGNSNKAQAGSLGTVASGRRQAGHGVTKEQVRQHVDLYKLHNVAYRTAASTASSGATFDSHITKADQFLRINSMTKDLAAARIDPDDALMMDLNQLLRQAQASSTPRGE